MKSSLDVLEGLNRKLNIEIPENMVSDAFNRMYKGIQKEANIKGFRKGKAPISAIKKLYKDRVKSDVLQNLVSDSYESALNEHSLDPISQPQLAFETFEEDQPFSFSAQFEVRPDVTLKQFEKLKVEQEELNVSGEQVEQILEDIRKSRAEQVPVFEDRAAKEGDVAEIDFEGFVDGAPLPNGSGQGHKLELGSQSFIEGFEEGIVGMKVGANKDLNLSFPAEYHAKEIAGRPVTFKVTLKKLYRKDLPELNDEFAQSMGEYKTLAELKETIKEDITGREEERIKEELHQRVLKALVAANPVDVPQSLLGRQKQAMIEDFARRMKQQGMTEKEFIEYQNKWDSDFTQTAAVMIQSTFLVDALAEKLDIKATQKDLDAKFENQSQSTGIPVERLKEFYQTSERRSDLMYKITEEKVVDYLLSQADIKMVPREKLQEG
ncbi:MAG: trigger factor [Pseudobdellovibrionaceae bacterium]|nr:trigger factor [Bdellovibrionales bacterium]USN47003.1 MAG: trigger factor [Pseudobdellovibrionaceae bacterium]